jgi:hypothetical protein
MPNGPVGRKLQRFKCMSKASATSSQLAGVAFRGCWDGLLVFFLVVPAPILLGGWDTDDTPYLPSKCPWQNLPPQPRKPGHQTAGGGRGPGVRAAHWHPGRPPPGWFGRGGGGASGTARRQLALLFYSVKNLWTGSSDRSAVFRKILKPTSASGRPPPRGLLRGAPPPPLHPSGLGVYGIRETSALYQRAENCGYSSWVSVRFVRLEVGAPASRRCPETALGAAETALGAAETALGAAETALGAAETALGAAETALGAAETALGAAETALGAAETPALGAAETALGAAETALVGRCRDASPGSCRDSLGSWRLRAAETALGAAERRDAQDEFRSAAQARAWR